MPTSIDRHESLTPRQTWSQLLPGTSQVLICDLQEQIVSRSNTTKPKMLAHAAEALCRVARLFKLPLTVSVVPMGGEPKLISALNEFSSGENQFPRQSANAFLDPATREHLASQGRRTIVLAGFAAEIVVLHTALSALDEGYGVVVAVDACGGFSERTELAALELIRQNGGIIASVVSIATALSPDFTKPEGQQMFQIVQPLLSA